VANSEAQQKHRATWNARQTTNVKAIELWSIVDEDRGEISPSSFWQRKTFVMSDVSDVYELGARIGKGSFGDVYHGVIKATGI
jgi:hypothetical protein